MATDLSKVKDREGLKPRREPYWQRLRPGCFLGYRPSAREGSGTWIARAYDEDQRAYKLRALGDFSAHSPRDKFGAAKKEVEAFAELIESGGQTKIETVEQACQAHAKANPEVEARFRRYVYSDPIAKLKLEKLRRSQVQEWRERLEAKPALISRGKGEQTTRPRSPSSVNRDMAVLRAALGKVKAPGAPNTEAAWQEPLRSIKNATKRRTLYLDRGQRKALLQHMETQAEPFVRALCLLPFRPGAMAGLTAADFDKRTSELTVGEDKTGKPRRILLPPDTAALFISQTKDKLPAAPLFMRRNGESWDKETWKKPIASAAKAARLPTGATAYTLRHSTITDLVTAGLPLLTIAQLSDTSVEMIERHYGHLVQHGAIQALAGLGL